MDQKIQYEQFRNKLIGKNTLLNDPEYLRLLNQYVLSLDAYVKEINDACFLCQKSILPGPRRSIDFYKLETARRFYEQDAYRYFNYRPGISGLLPPATRRRMVRGYLKDAHSAMSFGNADRANEKLAQAHKEVEALLNEVFKSYKQKSDKEKKAMGRELAETLALGQLTINSIPVMDEISDQITKIMR